MFVILMYKWLLGVPALQLQGQYEHSGSHVSYLTDIHVVAVLFLPED